MKRLAAIMLWVLAAPTGAHEPQDGQQVKAADIDALFNRWKEPGSPGCAVSVTQRQHLLFKGGYGSAILEAPTPNTPATIFHIASTSKQFTAFAIYLLQADGKLSVEDDVRKYVPELHDFGHPIRLADLLHHRSGLRDQWSLLALAGRRLEDVITQEDVIRAILAQRELNFPTGSRFAYSNSNYTLLALVVERVSGQSFGEFMARRVFEPLGMASTWVQDDFRRVRTGRAQPYAPGSKGFERRSLPYSSYGATSIQTNVEDMARWAMNLDQPRIGTRAMIDAMLTTPQDGTRRAAAYASGFEIGRYRGAVTVEHSGTDPGYVADFLMLPEHHLAISLLCNTEGLNPVELTRKIADLYLGDTLAPQAKIKREPVALDAQHLAGFAGTYKEEPGVLFAVALRGGKLFMQERDEMTAFGQRDFFLANAPVTFSFPDEATLIIHEPDHDRIARRVATTAVPDLTPARMQDYVGSYYSPELRTIYTVSIRGSQMWLSGPGNETAIRQREAPLREADAFYTDSVVGSLQFRRDSRGKISELALSNGRVINLRFVKLHDGLPTLRS
ncbi:serine hydrolase [Sphingomonas sp. DT-207]|uniref:serine hydrolase n=1 Tax=Sphingomonas sp. DT-207 TaxID=3396167 RepID=UPI003F1D5BED